MTNTSFAFLLLAAVMSILDWVAVARRSPVLEYVSKPAATIAFLAVVATLEVPHGAPWGWRLVAFAFCLVGDVFLMLPRDTFIPGLASFAVAQVMFTVSFTTGDPSVMQAAIGAVVVVPVALLLVRRFVGALRRTCDTALVAPVVAYMVVISAMAISAFAAGTALAVVGALFFILSDSLIAESRFVRSRRWHDVGIMVTYHLALAGLALGAL